MDGPTLFQKLLDLKQTNASNLADKLKNRSLQSGWNRFLQRKTAEPSRNTLQPAADYFGISVEAFYSPEVAAREWGRITGPGEPTEKAAAPAPLPLQEQAEAKSRRKPMPEEFMEVRRADVSFSNGYGQVVYQEEDHPPLVFRADFLRKLGIPMGKAVVVGADGDSNEPKICDGSVVLVNSADTENLDGDFFAFRVDGHLLIKRLERGPGGSILAVAENSAFRPKIVVYTKAHDFEVIGRAVWTGALLV